MTSTVEDSAVMKFGFQEELDEVGNDEKLRKKGMN